MRKPPAASVSPETRFIDGSGYTAQKHWPHYGPARGLHDPHPHVTPPVRGRVLQLRASLETDGLDAGAESIRALLELERLERDIDIPDHQRTTRTGLMQELATRDLWCRRVIYEAMSPLRSGVASFLLDVVDSASSLVVSHRRGAMRIADAGGHTIGRTPVSPREDRRPRTVRSPCRGVSLSG